MAARACFYAVTALRNTRKSTEHNLDLAFNSIDAQREACVTYIKSQAPRMPPPRPRVAQLDCLRGSEREIPTTKRRKAHKACPEDRQGTTLVLVARHEILMFPFERIRDVDRPARQERAVLLRQLARNGGVQTGCPRQP
jgi:hypothetical protein